MASISKLSIRGVRSFSPTDEEQVIGFCFPLTIIVGANGCGKTTIIESLKYAVTGSLPPGNKSGQSFVHDPKAVGQSNVKASIKLRFNNRGNHSMVVIRSMEVTQKKTTASFKALDGILRTVDPNTGERVSLSHKCTELDRQIPSLMGVSKPILEHVVFCHQEDASWPLQEGAVLKKRFDDIFDSTKYAKALQAIKDSKKEYSGQVKDLKADLEGLKSHKHAAQGFRDELETCKDEISGVNDEIIQCDEKIEEQKVLLEEAKRIHERYENFKYSLELKRQDLDKEEAVVDNQKSLLGPDDMSAKYDAEQLHEMLRDLENKHGNQAMRALEDKEKEFREIEIGLERLRRKTNEYNSMKGKLEAEKEAHERVLRQRFGLMEEIHKKHKVDLLTQSQEDETLTALTQGTTTSRMSLGTILTSTTGSTSEIQISEEDLSAFQRALKEKERVLKQQWEMAKMKHRREEDNMQKEIAELQAKKSAVENDRKRTEQAKATAMRELTQISNRMSSAHTRVRKSDVEDAQRQATRLAQSRDSMNNDPRREAITKEIRVQEDKLKSISATIEQDSKVRDQLRLQSDQQNEIDMLERQVAQEFEVLEENIKDNSFLLSSHGEPHLRVTREDPVSPLDVVANSVRRKHLDAEHDRNRIDESVSGVQVKISEKRALLGSYKQNLQRLQNRANQLNREDGGVQKILRVYKAVIRQEEPDSDVINMETPPQKMLSYLTDQINEMNSIEEKPDHTIRVVKRLKKMGKKSLHCPCCTRFFGSQEELDLFANRINELMDQDTSELIIAAQEKKQDLKQMLDLYTKWRNAIADNINEHLEYSRVNEEIKDLEELIAREGDDDLKELETELKEAEARLKEKKEEVSGLQQLVTAVNSIHDMGKRVWEKMGQVKSKKESLKYMFCGDLVDDGRDLKSVEKDLTKSSEAKEAAYAQINKLNNEQKGINEKISRITNQAATAERTAREKEDAYNRDQEATKRREELNEQLSKLNEEDKSLEKQIAPLRQRLMEKESDRTHLREANNNDEAALSDELKAFEKDISRLQDVNHKISTYEQSNKSQGLIDVESKIAQNDQDILDEEARLNTMKPELEQLKMQVNEGERQKKTILDNLQLLELMGKVTKLQGSVNKMQTELESMGGDDARNDYNLANEKIRKYLDKKSRCEGRMQGLSEQKRNLKRKLNEEEYKDVEERHRQKMIDYETTQLMVTDLDKYYEALDKALLRYHGMKINDINKIIRELWSLTYKGEDITNIEIVSGQDSASRANRSYNYRIVMSKGNTQMDMRGRCSAGQRVLASIVLRLALAETFCLNCGVMALDEPTTNLDYENKRGLAIALAQIIASRAAQTNFQLVVITHDEDFVSMMKQELSSQTGFNMPERYYQVSREEGHDGRFYSKINAIDWDEL